MDFQSISQFISNVGFPICAFGAIFYLYDKTVKDLTVSINKIDATLEHILTHLKESEKEDDTNS